MKKILCLALTLVMVFALSACRSGDDHSLKESVESMVPTTDPAAGTGAPETDMPDASMAPGAMSGAAAGVESPDLELKADEVLDAIRNVETDAAGGMLKTYAAAAKVLNFCKQGGPAKASFQDDVEHYFQRMSAEERTKFSAGFDSVVTLAQNIAKGDVEESELQQNLTEAGVDFVGFDPVNFQHQNLADFADAVLAHTDR